MWGQDAFKSLIGQNHLLSLTTGEQVTGRLGWQSEFLKQSWWNVLYSSIHWHIEEAWGLNCLFPTDHLVSFCEISSNIHFNVFSSTG